MVHTDATRKASQELTLLDQPLAEGVPGSSSRTIRHQKEAGYMSYDNPLQTMTAEQIMCQSVMTVPSDWSIDRLARFLIDKNISGAPVVDFSGQLVGVVSSSDIVRQTGSGLVDMAKRDDDFYSSMTDASLSPEDQRAFHESVDQSVLINDIMTPMVFEVAPDTPLQRVAEAMVKGRIHRVMVTHKGELCGIISALDLLKVMTL